MNIAVIGLGRFGSNLATSLSELGHEVLAIDSDERAVQQIAESVTHAVQADGTDEATLVELGITEYDLAFVAFGDIEGSILMTTLLKQLGLKRVHAKARNSLHREILERVGADQVVFPEREMAIRVAHNLAAPNVVDYFELLADYGIGEVKVPEGFVGQTLTSVNLADRLNVSILVIKRGSQLLITPDLTETLRAGDVLVVIGRDSAIAELDNFRP
ncbi:MAG: TrkA family potassium uptake protein [Chloroflexi bacterium]|nr:TrkA family potassium uptake protein [Chloroflexota bacterium]MCY3937095.1 TrkA family potassium uptake protein [Chloroflexota bacterium]